MALIRSSRSFASETVLSSFNSSDNLEELALVWLDVTLGTRDSYCAKTITAFRGIIDYLTICTNIEECIKYISTVTTEKVFLITSGEFGEEITRLIHKLPQIICIYVFCAEYDKHVRWASNYSKIRGVFVDIDPLLMKLRHDSKGSYLTIFNIVSTCIFKEDDETSIEDWSSDDNSTFRFYQLLLEILTEIPHTKYERDELIQECRKYYQGNKIELRKIDQFETTYKFDDAVLWYTKDSFVYRLVNKALRTENIDVILKFRFYIVDLYKQLLILYEKDRYLYLVNRRSYCQKYGCIQTTITNETQHEDEFSVYRGQLMSLHELHLLKQRVGCKILFKGFLSTTTASEIALLYCEQNSNSSPLESVMIEIKVNCSVESNLYANVCNLSNFKHENEILFPLTTSFVIISVEQVGTYWHIILQLNDKKTYNTNNYLDKDCDKAFELALGCIPSEHHLLKSLYQHIYLIYERQREYSKAFECYIKCEPFDPVILFRLLKAAEPIWILNIAENRYITLLHILQSKFPTDNNIFLQLYDHLAEMYMEKLRILLVSSYEKVFAFAEANDSKNYQILTLISRKISDIYKEQQLFFKTIEWDEKLNTFNKRIRLESTDINELATIADINEKYDKLALDDRNRAKELNESSSPLSILRLYCEIGEREIMLNQNRLAICTYQIAGHLLPASKIFFDEKIFNTYQYIFKQYLSKRYFNTSMETTYAADDLSRVFETMFNDTTCDLGLLVVEERVFTACFNHAISEHNINPRLLLANKVPLDEKMVDVYRSVIETHISNGAFHLASHVYNSARRFLSISNITLSEETTRIYSSAIEKCVSARNFDHAVKIYESANTVGITDSTISDRKIAYIYKSVIEKFIFETNSQTVIKICESFHRSIPIHQVAFNEEMASIYVLVIEKRMSEGDFSEALEISKSLRYLMGTYSSQLDGKMASIYTSAIQKCIHDKNFHHAIAIYESIRQLVPSYHLMIGREIDDDYLSVNGNWTAEVDFSKGSDLCESLYLSMRTHTKVLDEKIARIYIDAIEEWLSDGNFNLASKVYESACQLLPDHQEVLDDSFDINSPSIKRLLSDDNSNIDYKDIHFLTSLLCRRPSSEIFLALQVKIEKLLHEPSLSIEAE